VRAALNPGTALPLIPRRSLLAAALPLVAALQAPSWRDTLRARVAALHGPGLLQSYDTSGGSAFDRTQANCAYVYDNAVVGLALLAVGDTAAAIAIADALRQAQAHDRFWHDGRLRNAYRAGPAPRDSAYPLPGWWDPALRRWMEDGYQVGTATGVVAWAMLLWVALAKRPDGARFRGAAERAADWVERSMRAPRGFCGGVLGFEPTPQRLAWVSTEHNIDLAAAFTALGRAQPAAHARAFVAAMWQPGEGRFAIGLTPDGQLNRATAIDANLWPLISRGAQPGWTRALDWVLARQGVPAAAPDGVDFNDDRDGIWLEGTAITALTLKQLGRPAARFMATLRAHTAAGGLIYASSTPSLTTGLATGLDTTAPDFRYFRRPHIAPTGWAVLAESGKTPFPE
jgi:hypothetical protein